MKRKPARPNAEKGGQDGFTLVETVIAAFLLIFGLAMTLSVANVAMRKVAAAENKMEAMHTARVELENLRALAYDDSQLSVGTHTVNGLTYVVSSGGTDLKDIAMTIQWNDPVANATRSLTLTTTYADALH